MAKRSFDRRTFIKAAGLLPLGTVARGAALDSTGWPFYAGSPESTRYSSLNQITAANAARLKVAWVHHSAAENSRYRGSVECTPLVVDGVMYIVGADLVIQALDAATGKHRWTHSPLEPASGRRASGVCRGATYWKDGNRERLFVPVQNKIWCLDAKTGKPVPSFGDDGVIDLEKDADRDVSDIPGAIVSTTPGAVCQDVLIVTSRTGEGPRPAAPGHIR